MDKIYFYDLGIRKTIIDNLKEVQGRNDVGQLLENFLFAERMKLLTNNRINYSPYFWRTYTGAKLDYIKERDRTSLGMSLN